MLSNHAISMYIGIAVGLTTAYFTRVPSRAIKIIVIVSGMILSTLIAFITLALIDMSQSS